METFDYTGQEEYIWAMRTRLYSEDEDWKERRMSDSPSAEYETQKQDQKGGIASSDEYNTKVLASLVPDEIIFDCNDYSHRPYDACLLFGDVSGFTDLCEKYNKTGKGGPSRLTHVLNSYIGTMVQEIMSYNGDVLKFSGDAFLAMWKSSTNDSMQDCVHQALDCALVIQKTHGKYETDVGVFLRVKLAISAGFVIFSLIGDLKTSHYIVVGQPIFDVKQAEKKSSAGDIIVCHTAWNYLNPSEYLSEYMEDGLHIKVHGLGANWRSTQKSYKHQKTLDEEETESKTNLYNMNEEFSIRPSVNDAVKMHLKEDLRKYIIPPVMRGIDMDEPLEYLTEMRQIVILFINVVTKRMPINDFVNLIDTCYKIVCRTTERMEGCVNKVSLFDKDLMFVVIFGFRGFKHELDSQIGLRCATECYHQINCQPNVRSTSIGVTTGMTYCGVVGHTLRREYTVISLTVNKAARLMCAYPNKVTCDRETFLHSKLQATNFILQEFKHLKGITKAGPVYEFKEATILDYRETAGGVTITRYPILGRDDEMRLYLKLLNDCHEIFDQRASSVHGGLKMLSHHNTLILSGEARQGKKRLLEEIIFLNPKATPIYKYRILPIDQQKPYRAIQLFFAPTLGITPRSSAKERELRLMTRLRKMKVPELLCLVNPIFNVNFEKTPLFLRLTEKQKAVATRKMIKQLCYGCFVVFWVMAIEDANNIDEESWPLFKEILDVDMCFIVMTINSSFIGKLSETAQQVINHHHARTIQLSAIDKWYHAGLACQILGVGAIPPDLEKVIQVRSNGNPGWIESFLISLMQGGGLNITRINREDLRDLGLVVPAPEMLTRLTPRDLRYHLLGDYRQSSGHGWKMYEFSYKSSVDRITSDYMTDAATVDICTISESANIEDVDAELSLDVLIMKTYDSLSSYQQLLLKCSAVIGEMIPREMLNYVMNQKNPRMTAKAVQKLFEIKVLSCARGDFTQGDACVSFDMRLVNPNKDTAIKCDCKGIRIHDGPETIDVTRYRNFRSYFFSESYFMNKSVEACLDLPKYASCGYFRFRLGAFRETTYNLLTDSQRKEFHGRAVRYLEKETRKCKACGNAFFVRILGVRYDEGMKKKVKRTRVNKQQKSSNNLDLQKKASVYSAAASSTGSPSRSQNVTMSTGDSKYSGAKRGSSDILKANCFAAHTIKRLRFRTSLTKTFSYADFSNCQCPQILASMYNQLIEHCEGSDLKDKLMDAMLEYAYLCIISFNIPQAIKILNRALTFLETQVAADIEEGTEWKIPLMKAKIEALFGRCKVELGEVTEATQLFMRAMTNYGLPFPTSPISISLVMNRLQVQQQLILFCRPINVGIKQGYEAEFCDDVSDCLALMCNLFIERNMWTQAKLAAIWSLNKALHSDMDFFTLCNAYANMIQVAHHFGKQHICIALEVHALRLCHRKKTNVEPQELKGVAKLYGTIFCARFLRSEIEHAIELGFVMLRISSTIHAVTYSLQAMPILIQALIMRKRIMEAVTVLFELEYFAEEDIDNSGRTWYYALCIGIHLETGYTVIPFHQCERLFHIEGETMSTVRDPDAEKRYFTVMWLWCIRNEDWESAAMWHTKIQDFSIAGGDQDSIVNIFTALYLLEALLIFMVGKMDRRNIEAMSNAYREIGMLLSTLERTLKIVKVIAPRFYHLKAYYKYIRYEENSAMSLLRKAKNLAIKTENLMEESWIDHSEKAWTNNLSAVNADFWTEHCDPNNIIDYHEMDANNGRIGHYTLPTPLYI